MKGSVQRSVVQTWVGLPPAGFQPATTCSQFGLLPVDLNVYTDKLTQTVNGKKTRTCSCLLIKCLLSKSELYVYAKTNDLTHYRWIHVSKQPQPHPANFIPMFTFKYALDACLVKANWLKVWNKWLIYSEILTPPPFSNARFMSIFQISIMKFSIMSLFCVQNEWFSH